MLNALKRWWNKPSAEVAEALGQAFQSGRMVERRECAELCADLRKNTPPGYLDRREGLYIAEKAIRSRSTGPNPT